MIGTALSEKEQMEILNKLDKTDVPWNCAHGRVSYDFIETTLRKFVKPLNLLTTFYIHTARQPTMSHIRSLTECLIADDDAMVSHVAGPNLSVVGDV